MALKMGTQLGFCINITELGNYAKPQGNKNVELKEEGCSL